MKKYSLKVNQSKLNVEHLIFCGLLILLGFYISLDMDKLQVSIFFSILASYLFILDIINCIEVIEE